MEVVNLGVKFHLLAIDSFIHRLKPLNPEQDHGGHLEPISTVIIGRRQGHTSSWKTCLPPVS